MQRRGRRSEAKTGEITHYGDEGMRGVRGRCMIYSMVYDRYDDEMTGIRDMRG